MVTEREIEILKVLKAQFTVGEIVRFAKVPGHYVSNLNKLLPETIKLPGVKKETYNNLFNELYSLRTEFKGVRRDAYAKNLERKRLNKINTNLKDSIKQKNLKLMIKDFVDIHKGTLTCIFWCDYKEL